MPRCDQAIPLLLTNKTADRVAKTRSVIALRRNLKAVVFRAEDNGLDDPVFPNGRSKILKLGLIESFAWFVVDSTIWSMTTNWNALLFCTMPSFGRVEQGGYGADAALLPPQGEKD